MEEAIRKMTSLPAQRFNLKTKGSLREGLDADITVFDPKTITDRATYQDPRVKPSGIEYVVVNGAVVLSGSEFTEERPGRVIRRI
jgi:N-acyl-D-aspartate/D-glutamate deacylase